MGDPNNGCSFWGEIPSKWMMRGSPISGNLHLQGYIDQQTQEIRIFPKHNKEDVTRIYKHGTTTER